MKLIVIRDDGSKDEYDDVVDFGIIDKAYIQSVAEEYDAELTEEQISEVREKIAYNSELATYEELREVVAMVLGK